MISFKCPHCQTALQMENHYAGQAVLCPTCNGRILVPHPGASAQSLLCICIHCKALFQIPLDQSDGSVQCPTCNQTIQIPDEKNSVADGQMIRFTCRSCGQNYCIPFRYAGRKFTCPVCKHACLAPLQQPPHPKPISNPEGELVLLEEKPPGDVWGETLQPQMKESEPLPPLEEITKPKKSVLSKAAAWTLFAVVGFAIVLWTIISTTKSPAEAQQNENRPTAQNQNHQIDLPPTAPNALQAIDFSRSVITRLNRKSADRMELIYLFPDQVEVSEEHIQSLVDALSIGQLSSLETTIENARIEPGASYFITTTTAVSDSGTIRIIRIGFIEIENAVDDSFTSTDRWIFGLSILDEKQTLLASAGRTDQNELTSSLNEAVNKYSISPPSSGQKTESLQDIFNRFIEKYSCPLTIALLLLVIITIISMWVVFDKAGEPGWAIFVPVYNTIVLARIGEKSEWIGFFCAVSPIVPLIGSILNLLLFLYISIGVAQSFGRGVLFGIGLVFLPFIFYPILAFSEAPEEVD